MTNKNQKILALDLGTTTGWALNDQNKQITSGVAYFKPQRYEGGGMRYLRFRRWLEEINEPNSEINQIYFEEVRNHKGCDAAHVYGGLLAHLSAWCEQNQIPYSGIPVGTIKKHITGKGNSSKELVIKAIKNLGFNPIDDNEADALALLDLVVKGGSHA